jgi:hypothetical protein
MELEPSWDITSRLESTRYCRINTRVRKRARMQKTKMLSDWLYWIIGRAWMWSGDSGPQPWLKMWLETTVAGEPKVASRLSSCHSLDRLLAHSQLVPSSTKRHWSFTLWSMFRSMHFYCWLPQSDFRLDLSILAFLFNKCFPFCDFDSHYLLVREVQHYSWVSSMQRKIYYKLTSCSIGQSCSML